MWIQMRWTHTSRSGSTITSRSNIDQVDNPEKETYNDEMTGHPDGPIYLGDNALLRQWLLTMGPTRIRSGKYEGTSYSDIYKQDKQYANCLGRCLKLDADTSRSYHLDPTIKTYIAYSIIRSATFR